jgi:hypothetical protein
VDDEDIEAVSELETEALGLTEELAEVLGLTLRLSDAVYEGEIDTEVEIDRVTEVDTEGDEDAERVAVVVNVTETDTDADAEVLTEADVVGVTVMPGAMQQPGRTTLQLTSTKPAAVFCTQLLLRPALLG